VGRKKVEINHLSGERLRYLLKKYNMTGTECASRLNREPQHISYVINYKRRLTADVAREVIKLFPLTRFEWLMGDDDAETEEDYRLKKDIEESGAELDGYISYEIINECVLEKALLIHASKTMHPIINKAGNFPIESLYRRRVEHTTKAYMDFRNDQSKCLGDTGYVDPSQFNLFESPEQFAILVDSKVVANCDSNDLKKMNNKLREYLSYLIYQFILERNQTVPKN